MGSPCVLCFLQDVATLWNQRSMYVLQALSLSRRPAIAFVIVGLFWGCFAAYVPEVKARLGVNDATFGLLLLCNALGL